MTTRHDTIHQAIATLQRLSDLFNQRREQIALEGGVSVRQWGILEEIATEHFMPSLFAQQKSVTPAAISKLVRSLLERHLIRARIAEGDRRHRNYLLTAAGERLLDRVRHARQNAITEIWADLSVSELRQFSKFGDKLGDRLETYLEK